MTVQLELDWPLALAVDDPLELLLELELDELEELDEVDELDELELCVCV